MRYAPEPGWNETAAAGTAGDRGEPRGHPESRGPNCRTEGQVKGLDLGLVDFPSQRDGELVLLCWQFGEREVRDYHLTDEGFAGRKLLPDTVGEIRQIR